MTPGQILAAILLALVIGFGGAWKVQDWRMGEKLTGIEKAQALAIAEAGNVAREEEQRRQHHHDQNHDHSWDYLHRWSGS